MYYLHNIWINNNTGYILSFGKDSGEVSFYLLNGFEFRDIFLRKWLPLKFGLPFHLTHGLWEEENDHRVCAKMNAKHWPTFELGSKIPFPASISFMFFTHRMKWYKKENKSFVYVKQVLHCFETVSPHEISTNKMWN